MKFLINNLTRKIMCFMILLALSPLGFSQGDDNSITEDSFSTSANDPDLEWLPAPEIFPGCSFTVLHGDVAEPQLDFFFKMEPKTVAVKHFHNSAERMILVAGELEVQYDGEDPVVLKSGHYAYGPAKKPHKAKCLSAEPCVLFVAMNEPFSVAPITKID